MALEGGSFPEGKAEKKWESAMWYGNDRFGMANGLTGKVMQENGEKGMEDCTNCVRRYPGSGGRRIYLRQSGAQDRRIQRRRTLIFTTGTSETGGIHIWIGISGTVAADVFCTCQKEGIGEKAYDRGREKRQGA